jgi:hypothetical protein
MSDQIEIFREDPDAWGARLARAYATGEIDALPFTQTAAWAVSKEFTGWSAMRLVVQHQSGAWAGAQLLLQSLPGPLGRLAYAPRAPLVACADPGVADALRSELIRALRSLRADGVTLVRLELGSSTATWFSQTRRSPTTCASRGSTPRLTQVRASTSPCRPSRPRVGAFH